MIITCSQCKISFNLNEKILKPSGSKVRCSKCKHIFIAYPPEPIEASAQTWQEEPQAADPDVAASAEDDMKQNKGNKTGSGEPAFSKDEFFFETKKNAPVELGAGDVDFSLKIDSDEAENEKVEGGEFDEQSELELPDSDDFFESDSDNFDDLGFDRDSESDKDTYDIVEDTGDIDLSELEKILELDGIPDTKESEPETEIDELKFDLEPDGATDAVVGIDEQSEITAEELDLSDIEKMLDIDETETMADDEREDEELEFDLDLESDQAIDASETEIEFEPDDFDLSDLEDVLKEDQASDPVYEIDDVDLEFDLEDNDADAVENLDMGVSEITEDRDRSPSDLKIEEQEESADLAEIAEKEAELLNTFEMRSPERDVEAEHVEIIPEVKEKNKRDDSLPPMPVKKGVSLPLIVLLILALLAGGVYLAHLYTDIKIPFLSDMKIPEVPDPGGLKMTTFDISARFVENERAGRFFMITGKVKNGYPDARSFIKIMGKLYSKGKKLEETQTAFCGNLLTNTELAELDVDAIKKRLSNRLGDNRSNLDVAPGKMLPFMVVFTELPEELEEYTIEVVGSMAQ